MTERKWATGSFRGLMFREVYLARKQLLISAVTAFFTLALVLLVQLSCKVGNLAILFEGDKALLGELTIEFKVLAMFVPLSILNSVSQVQAKDERAQWRQFRRTLPVSGVRLMAAKYLLLLLLYFLCEAVTIGFCALLAQMDAKAVQSGEIGLCVLLGAVAVFMAILQIVLLQLTHSADKAGMLLVIVLMAVVFPLVAFFASRQGDASFDRFAGLNGLLGLAGRLLLPALLVTAAIFVLGFISSVMICKRREK